MSFVTRKDRSQLYYKEWGQVTSITLSHGWPLNLEQRK
jgi:non-heme chloroperoxidase